MGISVTNLPAEISVVCPLPPCSRSSGLWIRIRIHFPSWIRIRQGKFFKSTQKKCKEIAGNNCNFIQIFKENLHKLFCFLLLSNLLRFFNKRKLFIRLFLKVFFKAGFGSSWRKTTGSGSTKNDFGSTAQKGIVAVPT